MYPNVTILNFRFLRWYCKREQLTMSKSEELSRVSRPVPPEYNSNKCFSDSSTGKQHQHIQTRVKPYKCKYCDKYFGYSSNCKNHERIHTGEKPYQCKYCDKWFGDLSTCRSHERIHTGAKPYKCKHCATWTYTCRGKTISVQALW